MPAPRRAILSDLTDRDLDPKKKHELDKSGRLVTKKTSFVEETKVEVQTVTLESNEEPVLLEQKNDVVVSTLPEETPTDLNLKESVVSVVEPELQLDAEKPKSRFKPKKKVQSDS